MCIRPERKRGYVFEIVSFFGLQITSCFLLQSFYFEKCMNESKLNMHHLINCWYWKGKMVTIENNLSWENIISLRKNRLIQAVIQVYLHLKFQLWQHIDKTWCRETVTSTLTSLQIVFRNSGIHINCSSSIIIPFVINTCCAHAKTTSRTRSFLFGKLFWHTTWIDWNHALATF